MGNGSEMNHIQKNSRIGISVGAKVYAICLVMLLFLIATAAANYTRMTLVKEEVSDIATYTAPISKMVAKINILVLEQEISFERILRLQQQGQGFQDALEQEHVRFQRLNQQVSEYLNTASELAEKATGASMIRSDIVAFARISPEIAILRQDHQQFEVMAQAILLASNNNEDQKRQFLDQQLEFNESIFNQRIHKLQSWLAAFSHASILEIRRQDQQLQQFNIAVSVSALVIGILCAAWASRKIVAPLTSLITSSQAISEENYQVQIPSNSRDEIGELAASLQTLLQRVADKERVRTSFQEYLDPRVIQLLSHDPEYAKGKAQNVTVLFSDMVRFSKLSETLSPESLVAVVNEYYSLAGQSLIKTHGVVDKFIGDAIIAFWGQPFVAEQQHASLACQGALKQLEQLQHLRLALPDLVGIRKGLPEIDIRIGLASGNLVLGNIGTEKTSSFTIIGAAVSVAETLEQLNKSLGTHILVTEQTKTLAGEEFQFRLVIYAELEIGSTSRVYELMGYKSEFEPQDRDLIKQLESAIEAINNHDFRTAKAALEIYRKSVPGDTVANYHYDHLCLSLCDNLLS